MPAFMNTPTSSTIVATTTVLFIGSRETQIQMGMKEKSISSMISFFFETE